MIQGSVLDSNPYRELKAVKPGIKYKLTQGFPYPKIRKMRAPHSQVK
jgi:hypothetical protein